MFNSNRFCFRKEREEVLSNGVAQPREQLQQDVQRLAQHWHHQPAQCQHKGDLIISLIYSTFVIVLFVVG